MDDIIYNRLHMTVDDARRSSHFELQCRIDDSKSGSWVECLRSAASIARKWSVHHFKLQGSIDMSDKCRMK